MEPVFVDKEAIETLKRTNTLIEELLETLDVLADRKALRALGESAGDKSAGRVRSLKDFLSDVNARD